MDQTELFRKDLTPLAHKMRPTNFQHFMGHDLLKKKYPSLFSSLKGGIILYGPPGSGKTTLANLLAKHHQFNFFQFNAVLEGVPELRKIIKKIRESSGSSLLFIDEIHRFNKAQQDALLAGVEKGDFSFIGATTESPRVCLNQALISRCLLI